MMITSTAFSPGELIPSEFTCDGKDLSPPLAWTDVPPGTVSLALVSDDPDAPGGTWVHWVVWNLPGAARKLEAHLPGRGELPDGTRQGTNDFHRPGYGGPCPPSGTHRYYFRLYALDARLDLEAGATRAALDRAMKGHVLAQAELMGKYRRR